MRTRLCFAGVLLVAIFAVIAGPAAAAAVFVDDDRAQCPSARHTTIKSAVAASRAGDEIRVCRGLYTESVLLPAAKPGLRLVSQRRHEAVIRTGPDNPAPNTPPRAVAILALGTGDVISGFTFRSDALCVDPEPNSARGEIGIQALARTRIVQNRFVKLAADCEDDYSPVSIGDSDFVYELSGIPFEPGPVTVEANRFEKTGSSSGVGVGSGTAIVKRNTFLGRGVALGEGALGRVEQNTITRAPVGIRVLFLARVEAIKDNRLTANRIGLAIAEAVDLTTFPDNLALDPGDISGNVFKRNAVAAQSYPPGGPGSSPSQDLRILGNNYIDNGSLGGLALQANGRVRRLDGGAMLRVDVEAACPRGSEIDRLLVTLEQNRSAGTFRTTAGVVPGENVICDGRRRPYALEFLADGGPPSQGPILPGALSLIRAELSELQTGPSSRTLIVFRSGIVR